MKPLSAPIGHESPVTEVTWPVSILSGNEMIEGEIKDISAKGVSVKYHKPLESDEVLRIFIMPPDQETVVVSGELKWWHPCSADDTVSAPATVISFVKINAHDCRLVDELIRKHQADSAKRSTLEPDIS